MPYDPREQVFENYETLKAEAGESEYGSARVLCISPCLPSYTMPPLVREGLTLPFLPDDPDGKAGKLKPSVNFSINRGCNSCQAVAEFMLMIEPYMIGLALPLCYVKCFFRVLKVLESFNDVLTGLPVPDVTKPLQAIALALMQCQKCITGISPGKLCALVRDILDLLFMALRCIINLVRKLITLNLKISGLELNPNIRIQKTSKCIKKLFEVDKDQVSGSINALGLLFEALNIILEVIGFFMAGNSEQYKIPTDITKQLGPEFITKDSPLDKILGLIESVLKLLGEGMTTALPPADVTIHGIVCDCARNFP